MVLKNKLGITDPAELARIEEKLSKKKAVELFDSGFLDALQAGVYESLAEIHRYLFEDIYDFAGKTRDVNSNNLAKKIKKFTTETTKTIDKTISEFESVKANIESKIAKIVRLVSESHISISTVAKSIKELEDQKACIDRDLTACILEKQEIWLIGFC